MAGKLKAFLRRKKKNSYGSSADLEAPVIAGSALEDCKVFSNRESALELVSTHGMVVEVGVAYGDFSAHLLSRLKPREFFAIDSFNHLSKDNDLWGNERMKQSQLSHLEYYQERFGPEISSGMVKVLQGLSWECLDQLEDASADLIYIDADHAYESVLRDLETALRKVKPDGIIQVNDYTNFDPVAGEPYGVMKATNEVINAHNLKIAGFAFHPLGFHDVCLRISARAD